MPRPRPTIGAVAEENELPGDGAASSGPSADGALLARLAADERLRSGAPVHLRPIRPADAEALVSFHDRLSTEAVYRRYFFSHRHLTPAEVEHFTTVDYVDRMALVAEVDGRLVAVGRYERLTGTATAEAAFVVADEFQRQGIGTLLLEHLAERAWSVGITAFSAQTLAENREMVSVFVASGFPVEMSSAEGTVSVAFSIAPGDAYRQARGTRRASAAGGPTGGSGDGSWPDGAAPGR